METSSSNIGSMRSEKKKKKLGLWKPEEDTILKRYVEAHGEGNWPTVSLRSGLLRGGKSCRLRWKNYLRPNIKRGTISKEEEDLIIRMHKLLGNRWSLIAGRLPGRTDNEIKNYWNTHLNKGSDRLSKPTIILKPKNHVNVKYDKNIIQVPPEQSTDVPPERPDPTHQLEIIKQDTSHWIEDGDRMMINGYDALEPYSIFAPGYNHSMSLVFDDDELILPSLDSLVWIEAFGLDGE